MSRREIDRFEALGDSGRLYTVVVWTENVLFRRLSGNSLKLSGPTELTLDDGRDVSPIDDRSFRIVDTDEVLRRV